ncbi:hypothetical protein POTOM_025995 [Populus tomentosa]|uniref:Large ribosomal subunit protein uL15/eL18 domain-containing protein n=1 Tax=Populus tomentosa TaxID=118781 RepID=A0A8X8CXV1_POPTO|nr:hypothetical protein POTOM_025995 [Populus tomentosa]
MTTRFKKNRKKRGHVSAGHGRIGKHRKHPGGRGNAGGMHHHRILFDKYHPGYFGKVGMRYFHKLRNKFYCPIVNIDKLWSMVPQDVKDKATKDTVPMIDVTQFGYFKVLGKGVLPDKQPIVVKAKLISKIAEKKIKEAGGAVLFDLEVEDRSVMSVTLLDMINLSVNIGMTLLLAFTKCCFISFTYHGGGISQGIAFPSVYLVKQQEVKHLANSIPLTLRFQPVCLENQLPHSFPDNFISEATLIFHVAVYGKFLNELTKQAWSNLEMGERKPFFSTNHKANPTPYSAHNKIANGTIVELGRNGVDSKLGLGAKEVPHQSKSRQSNNPVERRLLAKLEAGKSLAAKTIKDSILPARDDNEDDVSSEEIESKTNAFAKKRPGPLVPTVQVLPVSEPKACWGGEVWFILVADSPCPLDVQPVSVFVYLLYH